MAYRVLEVTLQSAKNLKKVNLMSRLEVYAVATISGDPMTRQCTPPDPYGGRHPTWNATLRFSVPPTATAGANGCLHVLLRTERSLGDRDIGEVIIPLTEVLAGAGACGLGPHPPQFAVYQVRKLHRAETHGVLYLSYRLGPVVSPHAHQAGRDDSVLAYPVARPFHPYHQSAYSYMSAPALMPPAPTSAQASGGHTSSSSSSSSSSPPSPRAYAGHMALPPPLPKAYGHLSMPPPPPLQAAGHTTTPKKPAAGYAAASPWTNARNNGRVDFGMGLSAGLVGGAIGGMMAGDMMSDAAAYNAGYRAGMAREWSGVRGDRGAVY